MPIFQFLATLSHNLQQQGILEDFLKIRKCTSVSEKNNKSFQYIRNFIDHHQTLKQKSSQMTDQLYIEIIKEKFNLTNFDIEKTLIFYQRKGVDHFMNIIKAEVEFRQNKSKKKMSHNKLHQKFVINEKRENQKIQKSKQSKQIEQLQRCRQKGGLETVINLFQTQCLDQWIQVDSKIQKIQQIYKRQKEHQLLQQYHKQLLNLTSIHQQRSCILKNKLEIAKKERIPVDQGYKDSLQSYTKNCTFISSQLLTFKNSSDQLQILNNKIQTQTIKKQLLPKVTQQLFNLSYLTTQCVNRMLIMPQIDKQSKQNNVKQVDWSIQYCFWLVYQWCRYLNNGQRQFLQEIVIENSKCKFEQMYEHDLCCSCSQQSQQLLKQISQPNSFINHQNMFIHNTNAINMVQSLYFQLLTASNIYFAVKMYLFLKMMINKDIKLSRPIIITIKELTQIIDMNSYYSMKVKKQLFSYQQQYRSFIQSVFQAAIEKIRKALITNHGQYKALNSDQHILLKKQLINFIKNNPKFKQSKNQNMPVEKDVEEILNELLKIDE